MQWLKNIVDGYILDANYICRYFLKDLQEQYDLAKEIIDNHRCSLKFEVLAEVVYVMENLYEIPRQEITTVLLEMLKMNNIKTTDETVLKEALFAYSEKPKLDFVDCLLYGYFKSGYKVASFDKKLLKKISA